MIRRQFTLSGKSDAKARPDFSSELIVRFRNDVVTPPIGRVFSKRLAITRATLPQQMADPFEELIQEQALLSITPLFAPDSPKITLATVPTFASRIASSIWDVEDDELSGTNLLRFAPSADLERLQVKINGMPGVDYCERVPKRWLAARRTVKPPVSDPMVNKQWALRAIEWFAAGPLPDASKVKVAILDSGFDTTHPDLPEPSLYDHRGSSTKDIMGHGTHVAGIIAAKTNNSVGIAGISSCSLNIWKVFRDEPDDDDPEVPADYSVDSVLYIRALEEALKAKVHVMNLSLGGVFVTTAEKVLIRRLVEGGTTVVAAMGNGYTEGNRTEYPGALAGVIAVAAVDEANRRAWFSSTGKHVALSAPGVSVLSTVPVKPSGYRPHEINYTSMDGTSMAAPHVAAAAALLRAKYPNLSPEGVSAKLKSSVNKLKDKVYNVGTGLLSVKKLLS